MPNTLTQNNKINTIVRRQMITLFREVMTDPDFELKLHPETSKRLKKSVISKKKGETKSLDKILDKYR